MKKGTISFIRKNKAEERDRVLALLHEHLDGRYKSLEDATRQLLQVMVTAQGNLEDALAREERLKARVAELEAGLREATSTVAAAICEKDRLRALVDGELLLGQFRARMIEELNGKLGRWPVRAALRLAALWDALP